MKCIRPRVLIADIAFTENRFPVRRTTGLFPCSPQVRPVTLVRADADLAGEEDFAVLRLCLGPDRWVERTMSWLNGCRRLHRRY
jgi:hypothetical protein